MARAKGSPKYGGRKAGTPNKLTKEKREIIAKFIEDAWPDFTAAFNAITKPKEKCDIMVAILPFAVPKLTSIDYKGETKIKSYKEELDEDSGEITRR